MPYRRTLSIQSRLEFIPPSACFNQVSSLIKQNPFLLQQLPLHLTVDTRRCILRLAFESSYSLVQRSTSRCSIVRNVNLHHQRRLFDDTVPREQTDFFSVHLQQLEEKNQVPLIGTHKTQHFHGGSVPRACRRARAS